MFELPKWVYREIDRVRHDFLWNGCDISKPKCRLVAWFKICNSKDHGRWGILDISDFNSALLGKWWQKFSSGSNLI